MSDPRSDDARAEAADREAATDRDAVGERVDLDAHVSHYLCIGCPLGCRLEVEEEAGEIVEIRGQSCKKGEVFARQEHTDPRRVVTTTVAVEGGLWPRLPVKTEGDVPKDAVIDVCRLLHELSLEAPVTIGQVIAADVLGTGVDVVASRDMPRA